MKVVTLIQKINYSTTCNEAFNSCFLYGSSILTATDTFQLISCDTSSSKSVFIVFAPVLTDVKQYQALAFVIIFILIDLSRSLLYFLAKRVTITNTDFKSIYIVSLKSSTLTVVNLTSLVFHFSFVFRYFF